ncbi:Dyp-type peroxidase [Corynebacterium mendelii]|uniref:Dyp-type peroxidase n=1 Tax=Corynebacterium mendelii TaxID=2765362 RepID=A0A939DYW4_9CORY|nr:Dyp-type peroxidase [Corynebacterium mendelii]MBN9643364.1 Dyp-type peroxidase [Corynebacterium mendelii]
MTDNTEHETACPVPSRLSRRNFLAGLSVSAAGAAGLAAAGTAHAANETSTTGAGSGKSEQVSETDKTIPFDGPHQAGIREPAQANGNVVGFTVRRGVSADDLRRLMVIWTEDARRITAGKHPLADLDEELAENPASLTITCGFGERFFDLIGKKQHKPDWLAPLPAFERDELSDEWGQTDLMLQLCCDDQLTLTHATRHMIRSGRAYVTPKWIQMGFLPRAGSRGGGAPRNLFGLKDGTVNPGSEREYNDIVWIDEGPEWARGGSCMIIRRIAFDIADWEKLDRASRENVFGRKLSSGAPLTGEYEHDDPDFNKLDQYGLPVIDPTSHMARATNPEDKPTQKLRRRAYSYDLNLNPAVDDDYNQGLMFICYQKNPLDQFVPIQQRLDKIDRLNQWVTHIGSAVFVCPPGTDPTGADGLDTYWGQSLFES